MTPPLVLILILIAVGVYAILAVHIWIALHLRKRGLEMPSPMDGFHIIHGGRSGAGLGSIWEWRGACWVLVSHNLSVGVDPGPPPGFPGDFEGHTIKTWVRPR